MGNLGRLIASLTIMAALASGAFAAASDSQGIVYINLPGQADLRGMTIRGMTIRSHDAATSSSPTKATCQFELCTLLLPQVVYYLTLERAGFWPYTTAPFRLWAGQIVHFSPRC